MIQKLKAFFETWLCGKSILLFFLLILVFGLSNGLYLQSRGDEYRIPKKLNDGWEVASLSDVGIDTGKIEQVISEEWIKMATHKHIKIPGRNDYYGFCWWPGSMRRNGKEVDYVASFGYGGQTLYLIPELDTIIIFTCELTDRNTYVFIPVRKTFDALFQN